MRATTQAKVLRDLLSRFITIVILLGLVMVGIGQYFYSAKQARNSGEHPAPKTSRPHEDTIPLQISKRVQQKASQSGCDVESDNGAEEIDREGWRTHWTVISDSRFDINGDGKQEHLEIILNRGRWWNDSTPWCGMGKKWEGYFIIRVRRAKKILFAQSLNRLMNPDNEQPMFFYSPDFPVIFRDYNGDGQIDFNIGQYAGCMGNSYQLFTIMPSGAIARLPIKPLNNRRRFWDNDELYICEESGINSTTRIHRIGRRRISSSHYDQTRGWVTESLKWDGKQFRLVKEVVRGAGTEVFVYNTIGHRHIDPESTD